MQRWLWPCVLCACGRLGFDQRITADAASDTGVRASVAHVAPFLQRHPGAGATDSVTVQAAAAGDAIPIQVSCSDPTNAPTGVTATIPGWTLQAVGALAGSAVTKLWSQTWIATAPDAAAATFTVTWTGTTCAVGKAELADEFTADPSGAPLAFDAHAEAQGSGDCVGAITTAAADDAVYGACFSSTNLVAVGPGYTKGADDAGGDWAEYKLTADPAGTVEPVTFMNSNVDYVLSMVTIHAGS